MTNNQKIKMSTIVGTARLEIVKNFPQSPEREAVTSKLLKIEASIGAKPNYNLFSDAPVKK